MFHVASKKLIVHLFAGALLVTIGDFRIEGFGGLFGIEVMPETISTVFSLFVYIVIVNSWNLIDGIDGLADRGTRARAQGDVAGSVLDSLPGGFLSGLGIGHVVALGRKRRVFWLRDGGLSTPMRPRSGIVRGGA